MPKHYAPIHTVAILKHQHLPYLKRYDYTRVMLTVQRQYVTRKLYASGNFFKNYFKDKPYLIPCFVFLFPILIGARMMGDWATHNHMVYYNKFALLVSGFPDFFHFENALGAPHPLFYGTLFYPTAALVAVLTGAQLAIQIIMIFSVFLLAWLGYKLFNELTKNKTGAFLFASLIVLVQYGFTNVYIRGAITEYIAVNFAWIAIFAALFSIIRQQKANQLYWINIAALSFSFVTGTHPITLILSGSFIVCFLPAFIVLAKKNNTDLKDLILKFLPFIGLIIISNLSFFYATLKYSKDIPIADTFKYKMLYYYGHIDSLLSKFLPFAGDYNAYADGLGKAEAPFLTARYEITIFAFVIIMLGWLFKKNLFKSHKLLFINCAIFILLSLTLAVITSDQKLHHFLPSIFFVAQFGYRFITYCNLFLIIVLVICAFIIYFNKIEFRSKFLNIAMVVLITLCYTQSYIRLTEIFYEMAYLHVGIKFPYYDKSFAKFKKTWVSYWDYANPNLYSDISKEKDKFIKLDFPLVLPDQESVALGYNCKEESCLVKTNLIISRFLETQVDAAPIAPDHLFAHENMAVLKLEKGEHTIKADFKIPITLTILRYISCSTWFAWLAGSILFTWWFKRQKNKLNNKQLIA